MDSDDNEANSKTHKKKREMITRRSATTSVQVLLTTQTPLFSLPQTQIKSETRDFHAGKVLTDSKWLVVDPQDPPELKPPRQTSGTKKEGVSYLYGLKEAAVWRAGWHFHTETLSSDSGTEGGREEGRKGSWRRGSQEEREREPGGRGGLSMQQR